MTESTALAVVVDQTEAGIAGALFCAPQACLEQQGLIRMLSVDRGTQEKFTLHTLAERAMMDFSDGVLLPTTLEQHTRLAVQQGEDLLDVENGLVLALLTDGQVGLWVHEGLALRDVLREVHRYATRMIRLDVR